MPKKGISAFVAQDFVLPLHAKGGSEICISQVKPELKAYDSWLMLAMAGGKCARIFSLISGFKIEVPLQSLTKSWCPFEKELQAKGVFHNVLSLWLKAQIGAMAAGNARRCKGREWS